jgi:penicillin-binding protein 2
MKTREIKDTALESALFQRRAWLVFAMVCAGLLLLGARFTWLQVHRHSEFELRSEENRVRLRPLAPARGLIYDRNGELLAENIPQYRLELIPEQVGDVDSAVVRLAELLELDADDIERFNDERRARRRFENIPLKFQLSEYDIARFAVHRHEFPGVEVVPYLTRYYPRGATFAHVVGYVGRIDREDRQRLDQSRYAGSSHIGKTGIERHYEERLIGLPGFERVETDAQGRALRVLSRQAPVQGEHLYLTLDARLQAAAIAAFAGQSGAAVAIDPRNGEVLALVSTPGFDPNLFVNGISHADYRALTEAIERPLFNRALAGAYEPGSTMKPFIALVGLELGVIRPETRVWSGGEFSLPGLEQVWRDHRAGGHGNVDLNESMAQSVNTYFYQLAVQIGINRLAANLAPFGFGTRTGIDLAGESAGVLPSREWKRRVRNQNWFPGETVLTGIGQGYWVVTPLQLAHATATIAIDGVPRPPHVLGAVQSRLGGEREPVPPPAALAPVTSNPAHLVAIRDSMLAVMHGPTGTARASAYGVGYRIAGKTGTAQRVRRRDPATAPGPLPPHLRHRASFVAFAPAEAPTIALAVVVEQAESGSRSAAPVARRILDAWLVPGAADAIIEGRYTLDRPPVEPRPDPAAVPAPVSGAEAVDRAGNETTAESVAAPASTSRGAAPVDERTGTGASDRDDDPEPDSEPRQ